MMRRVGVGPAPLRCPGVREGPGPGVSGPGGRSRARRRCALKHRDSRGEQGFIFSSDYREAALRRRVSQPRHVHVPEQSRGPRSELGGRQAGKRGGSGIVLDSVFLKKLLVPWPLWLSG